MRACRRSFSSRESSSSCGCDGCGFDGDGVVTFPDGWLRGTGVPRVFFFFFFFFSFTTRFSSCDLRRKRIQRGEGAPMMPVGGSGLMTEIAEEDVSSSSTIVIVPRREMCSFTSSRRARA